MIVCKFGGKATISEQALKNVKKLFEENNERAVAVFSAIGKENDKDLKLTDLLILCAKEICDKEKTKKNIEKIAKKIEKMCKIIQIDYDVRKILKKIVKKFKKNKDKNYLVSRGEYITCKIMAKYLSAKFIDASKLIFFSNDEVDWKKTRKKINKYLAKKKRVVVPGFYGLNKERKIQLFSRGGGDVSGAIISKCLNANFYENWTDVCGIFEVNPEIIDSRQILEMNFDDLQCLTALDAKVIHQDCAKILKDTEVTLKIGSIFEPQKSCTLVSKNVKSDFVYFVCEKTEKEFKVSVFQENALKKQFFCKKSDLKSNIYENIKLFKK